MANNGELDTGDGKTLVQQAKWIKQRKKFGTFSGVFVPTLLTILGVILFLREGWVVGNAGLLGAWLVIMVSFTITACTALSLSSITTNIRIGAGGAFSVISQSLGLEVGGSIGVPLYLSQTLAVSMYIFGFRSGWLWLFPNHPALLVDLTVFFLIFLIAYISAGFAFKIQYVILGIIAAALLSIGWAGATGSMQYSFEWWGSFPGSIENGFQGVGFWAVFAVFFPASTGIMAGANMSGDLKNPRKSIPLGTLGAIALSLVIYLAIAYWLARSANTTELLNNYTVMIDKAAWGPAVIAGLLGATFSSGLSSIVGAPRILQALGEHNILPKSKWFAKKSKKGEPRNSLFLTAAIVLGAIMLRDLNVIAPLITMFFLLTYTMINVVVLIEQRLHLVSFRPMFKIPWIISLLGAVGCIFAMFIINPAFSMVAILIVLVIHAYLIKRHLKAPFGDVRSGLFVALAEWAVQKVHQLTSSRERTWKANLLLPVTDSKWLARSYDFIKDICYPKGFIKAVGLTDRGDKEKLFEVLPDFIETAREDNIFATWTIITASEFNENLKAGVQTLGGSFFKPNIILLQMPPEDAELEEELKGVIQVCHESDIGVLLYDEDVGKVMGEKNEINVWFQNNGPDWQVDMDLDNQDLALLMAYKFKINWKADLRMVAEVKDEKNKKHASGFLNLVAETGRIANAEYFVTMPEDRDEVPGADLQILPLPEEPDFSELRKYKEEFNSSCLFALDSGKERALA
ncbi:MAG: amino acid permease [Halanaerobiales bacterium]